MVSTAIGITSNPIGGRYGYKHGTPWVKRGEWGPNAYLLYAIHVRGCSLQDGQPQFSGILTGILTQNA